MDMPMSAVGARLQANGNILPESGASGKTLLREKAEELEGLFLNTLMSQMTESVKTDGMFGGGYAEETWRSMQSEQYASMIAGNGGIGLADQIMQNLIANQEAVQAQPQISAQSAQGVYRK